MKLNKLMAATAISGMLAAVTFVGYAAPQPAPAPAPAPKIIDVIATINNENISRTDFVNRLESRFGAGMLDQMITEMLIGQAAAKNNIKITDDQINSEIASVKTQFPSEAEFQSALQQYGLTLQTYKEQVKFQLILAKLGAPGTPTDADLKGFFAANQEKYDQVEEANVRHILLQTEDQAKEVLAKLKAGADFAEMAKEYSQDPGTKDAGGEVGFAMKGQLVPEFESVAFTLKPGEISDIVKTSYGFHIIQGIEFRPAKKAEFNDVKDNVLLDWTEANTKKPEDVVAALHAAAKITVSSANYKSFENTPAASK